MSSIMKKDWNVTGRFKIFIIISAVIVLLGVIALCFSGFNRSIEFTGGAEISLAFDGSVTTEQYSDVESGMTEYLASVGVTVSDVRAVTEGDDIYGMVLSFKSEINSRSATDEAMSALVSMLNAGGADISSDETAALESYLGSSFGFESISSVSDIASGIISDLSIEAEAYTISPSIDSSALLLSIIAIVVAFALVFVYMMFRCKTISGVKGSWSCGVKSAAAASIGIVHDALIVLSLTLLAGWLVGLEITRLFVAVFAFIIIYSAYNTLVVFSRLKDNNIRYVNLAGSDTNINKSVKEAFIRIVFTSAAIAFAALLMTVLGSSGIQSLTLPLLFGIISGTYSSLCITPCLWGIFIGQTEGVAEQTEVANQAVEE